MFAKSKDGSIVHFNADIEKVKKFESEGCEILNNDMENVDDPTEAAEAEIKEHTMTGTLDDFYKFCKENNVIIGTQAGIIDQSDN